MTIGLKDIIYLTGYIISLMAVLFTIRNQQKSSEKEILKISKIIFGDRGKLNLVDVDTCKQNRDTIFQAIRRAELVNEMLLKNIEELKQNVTIIMVYMGINKHELKDLNEKISVAGAERRETKGTTS